MTPYCVTALSLTFASLDYLFIIHLFPMPPVLSAQCSIYAMFDGMFFVHIHVNKHLITFIHTTESSFPRHIEVQTVFHSVRLQTYFWLC